MKLRKLFLLCGAVFFQGCSHVAPHNGYFQAYGWWSFGASQYSFSFQSGDSETIPMVQSLAMFLDVFSFVMLKQSGLADIISLVSAIAKAWGCWRFFMIRYDRALLWCCLFSCVSFLCDVFSWM